MNIFDYTDYRKFIDDNLADPARQLTRSCLARVASCSPSWITRALSGKVQLTPDQAFGIAQYFRLSQDETDYLLLLVEAERASSADLRKRIQSKLQKLRHASRTFSPSAKPDAAISETDSARYYASWVYSGVHVACMIRSYAVDELSTLLRVSETTLSPILEDLKLMGLLINRSGKWEATNKNVHLGAEHPMSAVGHTIWRNHAIQRLNDSRGDDLHYSAIQCLSKKDRERVRKKLMEAVLECRKVIDNSPSEELAILCLDWYTP